MSEREALDTKGLKCPLPVLKAKRALKMLPDGAELQVEATDPGSVEDFRHFCETTGFQLRKCQEADGVFTFVIEKSS